MLKTTKIRVGISIYELRESGAKALRGHLGRTNAGTKVIEIDIEDDQNQHPNELLDTLLHEVLHTVFIEAELESTLDISRELHEKVVTQMSRGLAGVVVDNPSLMKDITSLAAKTRRTLDI